MRSRNTFQVLLFSVGLVFWTACVRPGYSSSPARPSVPLTERQPQQLSPNGQLLLHTLVRSGTLSDLRWPDFGDYRDDVSKFYQSSAYSLMWVTDMQPTQQARDVITELQSADQKGLSSEDYDGSLWASRLRRLKPADPHPSESDAVEFDLSLTISTMRYISDLHVGKINPQHVNFQVNVAERRYDLADFLKEDVVTSPDVSHVFTQIEPLYPGYQRTIRALQTYLQLARQDDGEALPFRRSAHGESFRPRQ